MNQQWNPSIEITHDLRANMMVSWLRHVVPTPITDLIPMTGDASFRRYFRLLTEGVSYVVMDAPPDKEDVLRFMTIANVLIASGLKAPTVFAHNTQDGFLLLSDFGDQTYLKALVDEPPTPLYRRALDALAILQAQTGSCALPRFTHELMQTEWQWHQEWFLQKWLGVQSVDASLHASYDALVESALLQPQVFMYRDFHAGNLMVLPNHEVGLLDFQDAFIGPVTYDLASFLRDCYIDWPKQQVIEWALYYYERLCQQGTLQYVSAPQFLQWFDWMGVQRHLKALMTFARKALRDDAPHYLHFVPRTLNYIVSVSSQYDALQPIASFYGSVVLPKVMENSR